LGIGPKPLNGNISLMILVETRLKSGSFEPLIGFLGLILIDLIFFQIYGFWA